MSTTYREYIDQLNQEHTPGFYEQFKDIFKRALGVFLYDISGNPYLDCMSAFSAVNQGHCHDRIVAALVQQAGLMACTGQKIKNDVTPKFLKFLCELIGFDQCFMANSGVEAVEGGNKLARKYAFEIMGLPMGQGKIIVAEHNFHGRTSLALAMSTDQSSKRGFGPFPEGFIPVPFNDIETMKDAVERNPDVIAICIEPIQGEAGIIIPDGNYLQQVRDLCTKKAILFIADEIQSGLSRCGELTACSLFNVKPDILLLGKALSGGMLPISAVLANKKVMVAINERGVHGST
ncbi:aminotransferase class III-fold pyridoxal phosphate-dependent enzyme, partial [Candidatus Falkowbacteria bacterium]|nr:aminotransferase class III-fold pyridoxal phosphate-dependent enzyme [Candidatus Falkowbacteria bacterium]